MQVGTFILLFSFVMMPLGSSIYAYFKIYLHLKSVGQSRVGDHSANATRVEATIAMKMLGLMVLFVICWTPATVMMCWRVLRLPNSEHPLIDLWSGIACGAAGVFTPLLNCVLFESYRTAVTKRLPFSAPFIKAFALTAASTGARVTTAHKTALTMTAGMHDDSELLEDADDYSGRYRFVTVSCT